MTIFFESSIHGHALFSAFPAKSAAVFGECSFDRDLCGYRNQSGKGPVGGPLSKAALERKNPNRLTVLKDSVTWKLATPTSRPANLQDHTFRAPSKGTCDYHVTTLTNDAPFCTLNSWLHLL